MPEISVPKDIFCNEKIVGGSTVFMQGTARVVLCMDSDSAGMHFLVMPKNHKEFFHELSPQEFLDIRAAVEKITGFYKSKGLDGSHQMIVLGGTGSGSVISHFHFHVLPGNAEFHKDPKARPKHYTPDELKTAASVLSKEF